MTGEDIKEKVERYLDMTLKDNLILDGIQEAINKLGVRGHIIDTILLEEETIKKDEFYQLPKDFIRVIKVEIPEENKYYYNYIIDGNLIRFKDKNSYRIFAQKQPFQYNDLSEKLELHHMLQNCVLDYVKGFVRLTNTDQNEVAWNYIRQFKEESSEIYQMLKRDQKTHAKVRVRRKP